MFHLSEKMYFCGEFFTHSRKIVNCSFKIFIYWARHFGTPFFCSCDSEFPTLTACKLAE